MSSNCLTIKTDQKGKRIGDLFGIFFEDINHAADGGLYGEMVQNRSFEYAKIDNASYHGLTAWEKMEQDGRAEIMVLEGDAVNDKNLHFLRISILETGADVGVRNRGFGEGMYIEAGSRYRFFCYVRSHDGIPCRLRVSLRDEKDGILAEESIVAGDEWMHCGLTLEAGGTTEQGSLVITAASGKGVDLDFVSLFPEETYKGRRNGLRRDLAEALEDLKPKFMRFPGGCLVHDGSLDQDARDSMYRWKNTIGPVEERPARRNNWGYNQTLGLGYYEYFLFCEDIGAKPIPILPAAYNPHQKKAVSLDELDDWIQDALDLIEFARGGADTKWGAVRSRLGHPAPFGLEYIGIGNEEVGEEFRERFPYFSQAIRAAYPDIQIIGSSGPFCGGAEYELGWACARQNDADIVDEHYYMSPEWFIANIHRYDAFEKEKPYVFLGEYASCSNTAGSALAEAAFMTQLQNASHAVKMACYAPLLCHKDYVNWRPDLIWFDQKRICRSVNYEVQKLFMNHQGDELLPCRLETSMKNKVVLDLAEQKRGGIYLWGNKAGVSLTDMVLYEEDTWKQTCFPDVELSDEKMQRLLVLDSPQNYVLRFHVREMEEYNGFQIHFARKDEKNKMIWSFGGRENKDAVIIEEIGGRGSLLTQNAYGSSGHHEYDVELRITHDRIEGRVDGKTLLTARIKPVELEPLYFTVSREDVSSDVILKAVNLREDPFEADIALPELSEGEYSCHVYTLRESSCSADEGFPEVETAEVEQSEKRLCFREDRRFGFTFPERSVVVVRLKEV